MSRGTWAAVAGLTALAFAIRLAQLDQSLFGDELFLYRIVAHSGLGRVFRLVHDTESTPPLHFVLAWATAKVGDPTVWIRIPSLVAGTAMVPTTFALGLRTVGDRAALLGAAVVAIAPFSIFYGVEGRAYATLGLLAVLSTLALVRALDRPSRSRWALFALLTLAVVYTHYVGVFVVVAQGAWAAWLHRDRLRELGLAYLAVVIGYAPWIPSFLVQRQDSAAVRIAHAYPLTAESVGRGLLKVMPGDPLFPLAGVPGRAATAIFLVAGGAAVAVALSRGRARAQSNAVELLAVLALATPVGSIAYSLGSESIFLPRNLIPSLPAAALLLGTTTSRAGRSLGVALAAGLLGVLIVGAVKTFDPDYGRPPYRDAAAYIESHARPGDAVLEISIDVVTPLSPLRPVLPRRFEFARFGHRGTAATFARARARGHIFVVVPRVGALTGPLRLAGLRGLRVAESWRRGTLSVLVYRRTAGP